MAAELLAHAASTGDRRWIDRTHLAGRPIVDTAGPLAARLADAAPADAAAAAMRPDGTWTFVHTPGLRDKVRQTTAGRFDSLGDGKWRVPGDDELEGFREALRRRASAE